METLKEQLLKVWLRQGLTDLILEQVADEEPELMGYWVYRKRIKVAPTHVYEPAMDRLAELIVGCGINKNLVDDALIAGVMNAIWDRLSDEERQRWIRSI